ncbi:MAG: Rne/Rng family ribonuclease [Calditrichaeota bacterium]|nr:Rne/Rng family ribonuclease [Calditrichota bacterium]RQW06807.1 MAG: Rne/Rng family ribonuclease [Calditrichota bacterium]
MKKEIIINSTNEDTRIALLENGKLVEIFVERPGNERMVGDIYKGRVRRVVKGMQAAFINIGLEQDGFLHFSDMGEEVNQLFADIDEELISDGKKKSDVDPPDLLRNGQEIGVQIIKEPIITKGPRVTTELTLPGRFMVLAPNQDRVGVSRKISSTQERKRLRNLARKIRPKNFGIIIRTVAEGKDETVLRADLQKLIKTWKKVETELNRTVSPKLVFKDLGMASSVIRDLFTNDVERVVVDSRKMYREISHYLKDVGSDLLRRLEYFRSNKPIFDVFNIEKELQKSLERKVWMPNGGYIILEQTEALTTIDVNSGRYFGKRDHERNSLKINLESAREISRQLRLRDIGGLIVIDFIDMEREENKVKIQNELRKEFSHDRAVSRVSEISRFGLVEMTRQRIRPSLIYNITEPCPLCDGTGLIPTQATVLANIERLIRRYVASEYDRRIIIQASPETVEYLNKGKLSRRLRLMWKYWIMIETEVAEKFRPFDFRILVKKTREDVSEKFK